MTSLGFLDLRKGELCSKGSIAYVPQTAFLLNNTLRENILFGKKFDKGLYEKAIVNCKLVDVKTKLTIGFGKLRSRRINGDRRKRHKLERRTETESLARQSRLLRRRHLLDR